MIALHFALFDDNMNIVLTYCSSNLWLQLKNYYHVCECWPIEKLLLDDDIKKYYFVSQGKTQIDGVDDKEEFLLTDVSNYIIATSNHVAAKKKKILDDDPRFADTSRVSSSFGHFV